MNTTATLTKSAIKMFVRNRQALFFTLFMPMIIMTIFGLVGFDKAQTIPIGIVTASPTAQTRSFIDGLKQVSVFDVKTGNDASERSALDNGDRALVLVVPDDLIPSSFGPGTVATSQLLVLSNAGQPQLAQAAMSILNQILDKTTFAVSHTPQVISVKTEVVNSHNLKYIDFLLPGIVAIAIMQMGVFSVAFAFVDYKEKGILKRLLATPMRPYQFVTANVVTRLLVAIVQAAILMAIGVVAFKAQILGAYWLVFLIALLGSVMFLGLGFTISGVATTVESVPAIANLVVFPMLFLGGTFFPITSMPDWLQHIVKYLPITFFTGSLRDVMTKGAGIADVGWQLVWMAGWSVVLIGLATITFGFEEKRM